jgi:hypothetical protein
MMDPVSIRTALSLCRLSVRCDDRPAARPNNAGGILQQSTTLHAHASPPVHQIANYFTDKRLILLRALDLVCCLAHAVALGLLPPLHDRSSRNTKSASGHHHQDDHGILNRQQRLGATTATGTIIRVAG